MSPEFEANGARAGDAEHRAVVLFAVALKRVTDPDFDVIVCYGNAKPTDTHLASTIHCIDGEIIEWLARRERRRHKRVKRVAA